MLAESKHEVSVFDVAEARMATLGFAALCRAVRNAMPEDFFEEEILESAGKCGRDTYYIEELLHLWGADVA